MILYPISFPAYLTLNSCCIRDRGVVFIVDLRVMFVSGSDQFLCARWDGGLMFCLSQTTGYAILALACLDGPDGNPVQVRDVADFTGISKPYLSKIIHALGAKGLVETKRGRKGGVLLARDPRAITVIEVARAVEGNEWAQRCVLGLAECSDERACPMHFFWKPLAQTIRERLEELTLAQVAEFESRHALGRLADKGTSPIAETIGKRFGITSSEGAVSPSSSTRSSILLGWNPGAGNKTSEVPNS